MGAGALGLGTIVSVAATTAAADVTGIILASVLAAIGFFILPAKRKQAKEEMRTKIAALRTKLSDALRQQFRKEIERSVERIRESIAPYSRFIRAEGDKLQARRAGVPRNLIVDRSAARAHRTSGGVAAGRSGLARPIHCSSSPASSP